MWKRALRILDRIRIRLHLPERLAAQRVGVSRRGVFSLPIFLGYWLPFLRLGLDAQHVIAMRLRRLSPAEAGAPAEATLMVTEKIEAFGEAQAAFVVAITRGAGTNAAMQAALAPYSRRVRANCTRLELPSPAAASH